jgi:hypothetical protein
VGGREGVFFMPLHSITWNEKRTSKCEAWIWEQLSMFKIFRYITILPWTWAIF